MESYIRFQEWVRIAALFGAIFIAELLLKAIESSTVPVLAAFILGITGIASMHVIELAVTTLFDRWEWLRRFILGGEYIEGTWVDHVVGEKLYGLIYIQIRDGKILTTGEQFDENGKVTATWENYFAHFVGNTLHNLYRAPHYNTAGVSEVQGYSVYVFHGGAGKPPQSYSGFFADTTSSGGRGQVEGFKVSSEQILRKLASPTAKYEVLVGLSKGFQRPALATPKAGETHAVVGQQ